MYTRCSLCNETDHRTEKCPDLCEPLKNTGFSGAGGGGGGHSHDDDDESIVHSRGNSVGVYFSDQNSGYTTRPSFALKIAAHQLNVLFEMTAPPQQEIMTSSALSSSGSSASIQP
jgi:hypothetical protein